MPLRRKYCKLTDAPPTRVCPMCKQTFTLLLKDYGGKNHGFYYQQTFCSKGCANRNRMIDGGTLDRHGYRVFRWQGYPQVYEHRLNMEQMIGRALRPHETVHHKNGDRADNRPENLELWSSRHGKGQRTADLPIQPPMVLAGMTSAFLSFGA